MPSDGNTSHDPSNQTDLTGKYNSHVIAHCVISQVRKMVSRHIVFELLTGLFFRISVIWKQLDIL
jgi:hypothetical protein